jgi:hypothetical protein
METATMLTTAHILLAIAGLGCLAAAIAHSALGERLFVPQIQAQMNWPGGPKAAAFKNQIVRLAWHVTSVMWAGFAALFIAPLFGFDGLIPVYLIAAAIFAITLILTGPMTAWRHVGWPVFAVITASLIGAVVVSV